MKRLTGTSAFGCIVLAAVTSAYGSVSVTISSDAAALAGDILAAGVHLASGSASYTGAGNASGFFADGLTSGIGIESGVILTSGNAAYARGANSNDSSSGFPGLPGDGDLTVLSGGSATYDATVLEFDFTIGAGDLFIRYVFASEEYNEYANTPHHDALGVFIDGTNVAVVPGTDTPVSVNTVNGGGPAFGAGASYPEFFNNNDLNDGGPFFDFAYDGFTDVFTAEARGLTAGLHHMKIAIADTADPYGDSAVLIQDVTFSGLPPTGPLAVPVPSALLLVLFGVGCIHRPRRRSDN